MAEENKNQQPEKPVEPTVTPAQPTPTPTPTPAPAPQPQEPAKPASTPPPPATPGATIPNDEKYLAAISYLSIAFVLPIILKPGSKLCQFHAKRGMGMFILSIIILFILVLIPILGSVLFLIFVAISILGIFKAGIEGAEWKIPGVGDVMEKVDLNKIFGSTPPPTATK